jgi:hypothetical protein
VWASKSLNLPVHVQQIGAGGASLSVAFLFTPFFFDAALDDDDDKDEEEDEEDVEEDEEEDDADAVGAGEVHGRHRTSSPDRMLVEFRATTSVFVVSFLRSTGHVCL